MAKTRTRAETEKLKDYAKLLFTKDRLSQKEISEKTGISEKTIGKWVIDGGWLKMQKNFMLTREEQMGNLLDELAELNGFIRKKMPGARFADSKEGDVRRKLIRDIKDLETKAVGPEAMSVCRELLDFIRKIDLVKAQDLVRYIDAYVKSKLA